MNNAYWRTCGDRHSNTNESDWDSEISSAPAAMPGIAGRLRQAAEADYDSWLSEQSD